MVGDRAVLVSALDRRDDDLRERLPAVAPIRVHLEIAAIVVKPGTGQPLVAQHRDNLRAAEVVRPPPSPILDRRGLPSLGYGAIDRLRAAGCERLDDDPRRGGTDVRDLCEGAVRL